MILKLRPININIQPLTVPTTHLLTLFSMSVIPNPPPTYSPLTYSAPGSYVPGCLLPLFIDNITFLVIKAMHDHIENVKNKKYKKKHYSQGITIIYISLSTYFHIPV